MPTVASALQLAVQLVQTDAWIPSNQPQDQVDLSLGVCVRMDRVRAARAVFKRCQCSVIPTFLTVERSNGAVIPMGNEDRILRLPKQTQRLFFFSCGIRGILFSHGSVLLDLCSVFLGHIWLGSIRRNLVLNEPPRRAVRGGREQGLLRFLGVRAAFSGATVQGSRRSERFFHCSRQRQKAHAGGRTAPVFLFSLGYSVCTTSGSFGSSSGSLQSVNVSSKRTNLRTKSTSSAAISSSGRSAKKSAGTPRL